MQTFPKTHYSADFSTESYLMTYYSAEYPTEPLLFPCRYLRKVWRTIRRIYPLNVIEIKLKWKSLKVSKKKFGERREIRRRGVRRWRRELSGKQKEKVGRIDKFRFRVGRQCAKIGEKMPFIRAGSVAAHYDDKRPMPCAPDASFVTRQPNEWTLCYVAVSDPSPWNFHFQTW